MTSEELFKRQTQHLKVAVMHDWVFTRRGGEKVLEQILHLVPNADVFTLFGNPKKILKKADHHKFTNSFLAAFPFVERFYKLLLPLFPIAVESFDLTEYDLVISSSSCVAKGAIARPSAKHVTYIHSPMRYAWDQEHRYFKSKPSFFNLIELFRRACLSHLRMWDVTSAARSDLMLANSAFVARRCQFYYNKVAQVVYPPVEVERFAVLERQPTVGTRKILIFGAWVPYKKMYDAVEILLKNGFSIVAAGDGADFQLAKKKFSGNASIDFFERPDDKKVQQLFASCHTFLFPAIEDFGITVVEAQAAGLLVVCPAAGGTLETVVDGETGFCFREGDADSMVEALRKSIATEVDAAHLQKLRTHARKYSESEFRNQFSARILPLLGTQK